MKSFVTLAQQNTAAGAKTVQTPAAAQTKTVTQVPANGAQAPEEPKKRKRAPQAGTYVSRRADVKSEIDVRGQMLEEAMYEVDKYLADAYSAGLGQVSIIHGKGTGVLRNGILYRYPVADFDVFVLYDDGSVKIIRRKT